MTVADLRKSYPVGTEFRIYAATAHVTGHGKIDGEPVVYANIVGGGNVALTADRLPSR